MLDGREHTSLKHYVLRDLARVLSIILLLTAHIGQTLKHPIGDGFRELELMVQMVKSKYFF